MDGGAAGSFARRVGLSTVGPGAGFPPQLVLGGVNGNTESSLPTQHSMTAAASGSTLGFEANYSVHVTRHLRRSREDPGRDTQPGKGQLVWTQKNTRKAPNNSRPSTRPEFVVGLHTLNKWLKSYTKLNTFFPKYAKALETDFGVAPENTATSPSLGLAGHLLEDWALEGVVVSEGEADAYTQDNAYRWGADSVLAVAVRGTAQAFDIWGASWQRTCLWVLPVVSHSIDALGGRVSHLQLVTAAGWLGQAGRIGRMQRLVGERQEETFCASPFAWRVGCLEYKSHGRGPVSADKFAAHDDARAARAYGSRDRTVGQDTLRLRIEPTVVRNIENRHLVYVQDEVRRFAAVVRPQMLKDAALEPDDMPGGGNPVSATARRTRALLIAVLERVARENGAVFAEHKTPVLEKEVAAAYTSTDTYDEGLRGAVGRQKNRAPALVEGGAGLHVPIPWSSATLNLAFDPGTIIPQLNAAVLQAWGVNSLDVSKHFIDHFASLLRCVLETSRDWPPAAGANALAPADLARAKIGLMEDVRRFAQAASQLESLVHKAWLQQAGSSAMSERRIAKVAEVQGAAKVGCDAQRYQTVAKGIIGVILGAAVAASPNAAEDFIRSRTKKTLSAKGYAATDPDTTHGTMADRVLMLEETRAFVMKERMSAFNTIPRDSARANTGPVMAMPVNEGSDGHVPEEPYIPVWTADQRCVGVATLLTASAARGPPSAPAYYVVHRTAEFPQGKGVVATSLSALTKRFGLTEHGPPAAAAARTRKSKSHTKPREAFDAFMDGKTHSGLWGEFDQVFASGDVKLTKGELDKLQEQASAGAGIPVSEALPSGMPPQGPEGAFSGAVVMRCVLVGDTLQQQRTGTVAGWFGAGATTTHCEVLCQGAAAGGGAGSVKATTQHFRQELIQPPPEEILTHENGEWGEGFVYASQKQQKQPYLGGAGGDTWYVANLGEDGSPNYWTVGEGGTPPAKTAEGGDKCAEFCRTCTALAKDTRHTS